MKILAIGNSFSEDATTYLYQIAKEAGVELFVVNLYIGGCSLEMHAKNLSENAKQYKKFINTAYIEEFVSIKDTLLSDNWDIVTIQQASYLSGLVDTYEPYASELLTAIKQYAPQARVYFHQTWAYEIDSALGGFANYEHSQNKMVKMINSASKQFCKFNHLPCIPSGELIDRLRHTTEFDYSNGKQSLCRDGYHMSLNYGRYAVGALWFQTLTGVSIRKSTFVPEHVEDAKICLIKSIVDDICKA